MCCDLPDVRDVKCGGCPLHCFDDYEWQTCSGVRIPVFAPPAGLVFISSDLPVPDRPGPALLGHLADTPAIS